MNEVWRARVTSSSKVNVASLVKICRSGQNRIRVPVTPFFTRPPLRSGPTAAVNGASGPSPSKTPGAPRWNDIALGRRRAVDLDVEPRRQRVDHRGADAVQAAGGDVRAAAELAAGVELGEDHLDARAARSWAPCRPGCRGRRRAPRPSRRRAASRRRGARRPPSASSTAVVDDLPQAVHQAAGVGRADVHPRALADRLQSLEHQEVVGVVRVVDRGSSVRAVRACSSNLSAATATNASRPARDPVTRRPRLQRSPRATVHHR